MLDLTEECAILAAIFEIEEEYLNDDQVLCVVDGLIEQADLRLSRP